VTEADGKSDVNAILDEDFTVTEPLPSNAPFRGIFDGNGHTLYLNIDRGTNNTGALFLTTAGQDPHGIIIPGQWQWPTETTCIKEAYPDFNTWASDHTKAKDWYNNPKAGKVVKR
jgi:hypothetical protein